MTEIRLETDAWGKLVLITPDETRYVDVAAVRAFPLTAPRMGVSIVSREGRELSWIENLDTISETLRKSIEQVFQNREFMPRILRITHISGTIEPTTWDVQTDRGETRFTINSEDDVHNLDENQAMIIDKHGIRYRITDLQALDGPSRRVLERYL